MVANEAEAADICCASCGIAEVDDIKLNECNDCDLVKYCSEKCQQDHRPHHGVMCKERAANYVTRFYLSSLKGPMLVIARFVSYHCRLINKNP